MVAVAGALSKSVVRSASSKRDEIFGVLAVRAPKDVPPPVLLSLLMLSSNRADNIALTKSHRS